MARVVSVAIRRFKRIELIEIPLGDVTLLIGANNSGKSSVLQAIHFAVSIAQSARLVGEGVAWRNDAFELSFNPAQLLYSPVADVLSLATGGALQEPRPSQIEIEFTDEQGERCTVGLRRGRNRNIAANQRALCELVFRLASERGFQALISTHSRHVLDSMKSRCGVIWLSKGKKIEEPDLNTTAVLLDLGALDSVDYFADGHTRCVVATEDTEKEAIRAVLWSNGFVEDDTEVASYTGCTKVDAAVVLGRFLAEKAPHVRLVVHRDRDYLSPELAADFENRLNAIRISPLLTDTNDIEGCVAKRSPATTSALEVSQRPSSHRRPNQCD